MSLRRLPRRIFILAGVVPLVLALWGPAGARAAGGPVADSSCAGRSQNVGPQLGCGGPATSLIFSIEPGGTEVNTLLDPQPVVEAVDDGNNVDPTYNQLVTISIDSNPGSGTLHGGATVQAVDGVASFGSLYIDQPGVAYTLEATGPEPARAGAVQPADLAPAVSDPFDITAPQGGTASHFIFSTEPGGAETGQPLSPQPVVEAVDNSNNVDPTYDHNIDIVIGNNPSGGTLSGTTTVQAVNGVATFTDLSIDQAGLGYTLVADGPEPDRAGGVGPASDLPSVESDPFDITSPMGPAPASCNSIYGVSDTNNNSRFFQVGTVPPNSLTHLGGVHAGYNFEGIEIDPLDGSIYAATAAGNKHGQKGTIFQVDGITGALTLDFSTGYQDIEGLAFRSDGALWAWVDGKGLIIMDPVLKETGVVVLSKRHFEAMAWNNAENKLYLAKVNKLWTWDPSTLAFKLVASNLPAPVLGMDVRPDGDLLLGVGTQQKILIWNPVTKSTVGSIATPGFGSIQSLARAESCNVIG
jgi:hypothetical protein